MKSFYTSLHHSISYYYPMKATLLTASSCRRLIVLIWVLSGLTCSVFFYTFSSRETGAKTYCTQRWYQDDERDLKARKIHFTYQITLLIVTPLVLIIVLHTAVVVSLSKQENRKASHFRFEPLKRRAKQHKNYVYANQCCCCFWIILHSLWSLEISVFLYTPHVSYTSFAPIVSFQYFCFISLVLCTL